MSEEKVLEFLEKFGTKAADLGGQGWELLVYGHQVNAAILSFAFGVAAIMLGLVSRIAWNKGVATNYGDEGWYILSILAGALTVAFTIITITHTRGLFIPEVFALQNILNALR